MQVFVPTNLGRRFRDSSFQNIRAGYDWRSRCSIVSCQGVSVFPRSLGVLVKPGVAITEINKKDTLDRYKQTIPECTSEFLWGVRNFCFLKQCLTNYVELRVEKIILT